MKTIIYLPRYYYYYYGYYYTHAYCWPPNGGGKGTMLHGGCVVVNKTKWSSTAISHTYRPRYICVERISFPKQ